ncbi:MULTISPECIES: DUF3243 domain-containing protein [unclassified Sporolactobacillus]|uniref:DUF3243 domain-containing protein n=1 Tax=unclassified Sporolactobacillus TaxID=2628533 RepID=UPI0023681B30|nr:DUF3243 domain-containing protein [Sporolactobacillus sp. CQH2019]MDD9147007.1 DUF3243 domain-containing protein [Sporolactobacillus sp. CQH2019]
MSVLDNWDHWKDFLGDRIQQAKSLGVDQEALSGFAKKIGDYLNENVDPKTEQERVLSDLWNVADEHERLVLASLMIKLVTSDTDAAERSV